ncbi:MAG: 3'(2'),5'-bisphosphate nucleotidase CysQ [Deltaproteobacteria bacterium]|nr:3'(2'),5'-bisphosphate nucleotidase CysQ [Deltaproteobacteria bacterium]
MSYEPELSIALEAAREAGAILRRHYECGTETWEKSKDNPVTLADLEADKAIADRLGAAFPGDAILSEETIREDSRLEKSRVWIVDPMDGTKEFTKRIPEFAVSIALTEDGEPVVGAIHNPAAGVTIWATRGGGTFRDEKRVSMSDCKELADAVVIASRTEISRDRFAPYDGWFQELRPVGSIAWKLACVACGDGDLNISLAPKNEWDVCAGDLLIREAGGIYVDFDGATRRYNQEDPLIDKAMAAGERALLERFLERHHKMG